MALWYKLNRLLLDSYWHQLNKSNNTRRRPEIYWEQVTTRFLKYPVISSISLLSLFFLIFFIPKSSFHPYLLSDDGVTCNELFHIDLVDRKVVLDSRNKFNK